MLINIPNVKRISTNYELNELETYEYRQQYSLSLLIIMLQESFQEVPYIPGEERKAVLLKPSWCFQVLFVFVGVNIEWSRFCFNMNVYIDKEYQLSLAKSKEQTTALAEFPDFVPEVFHVFLYVRECTEVILENKKHSDILLQSINER